MAFKIEDLVFSITLEGENEAVMRLEGCDDLTMEAFFASCGKTQPFLACVGELNLANEAEGRVVAFRPRPENLQILEQELKDALEAVRAVRAALAAPVSDAPPPVDPVDGEPPSPPPA